MRKLRPLLPILLILLLAFALRAYGLTEVPPGLTHDEANHGREAISILQGNLALFFPLNYGSEPLYSYTVAAHMLLLGRGLLALRLVNVFFGLLAIAATYRWGQLALGRSVALLASALMAVSFWPLASSREALRAGMMPFFTAGAAIFFWILLRQARRDGPLDARPPVRPLLPILGFALCVAATLYNYLAARVVWLLFPAFLVYLALLKHEIFRRLWQPTVAGLLLAGLLVVPMFLYLERHPEAQTRLQMLDSTLQQTVQGNIRPVLENGAEALLAFFWPGYGDQFLAYNIPGRPVFDGLTALFFLVGIAVCLWRWRRPAYAFLLLWFLVGIIPSLITGATANTTRNVGALAPTFLLPAVGFVVPARALAASLPGRRRLLLPTVLSLWLLFVAGITVYDYFQRWAQSPDVRAAYQHTLVAQLAYLKEEGPAPSDSVPVVISSVYPGPAHNPSIALVMAYPRYDNLHWIDARRALLFPEEGEAQLLVPASTPLHPAFAAWTQPQEQVQLRADDLNPSFTRYHLLSPGLPPSSKPVVFGQEAPALTLLEARWLSEGTEPGGTAELLLLWRVEDPSGVGPVLPAFGGTDVVLFTHVLDEEGEIIMQDDRLDAPSWDWRQGDIVAQVHQMVVPLELAPGTYRAAVGVYDRQSAARLPLYENMAETRVVVDPLVIIP